MKLSSLLLPFRLPKVPVHGEKERQLLRKEAVMQTSNGNILLQNGRFVTKKMIEAKKKELFAKNAC